MSIFKRMFKSYVSIVAIIIVCLSAVFSFYMRSYTVSQQVEHIKIASKTVERWTGGMHIEENDTRARNVFNATLSEWGKFLDADIVIYNNDNEITAWTAKFDDIPSEYFDEVKSGKYISKIQKIQMKDGYKKCLIVGIPIRYQNNVIGTSFYVCELPAIYKNATVLSLMFIIAALITLMFTAVIIYLQSKNISRPIIRINNAVRDIAAGNFSQRVTVETNDEIGQLASSFNFMADSIEKLEESHSSFCSDVSHELRTPMTSISGFVEGILDGTIPAEKQDYYLRIVLDETKRLTKFVNDTLEMSKMSSSEYQLDITEFDINELIRTCIISLGNRIDEKNLDLNVDFKQDVFKVLADKDSIKRVVLNIMDNAIKFSYPNTTMGVSTWAEKGKIYVCIGNFGDGIDSSDLSNIFNRYYKTDKSRTNEKTGAGLGLSLVKNILVLHKQAIWVESVDTKEGSNAKYTKFTFTLEKA